MHKILWPTMSNNAETTQTLKAQAPIYNNSIVNNFTFKRSIFKVIIVKWIIMFL